MENPLRKQIRSIMKDHKKRQMWYRIVTTLAVVVVFVTTYMLILPAITMENKAECGITEHKHDANCYSSHYEKEKELVCTTDSLGVHKHTDACYDAEHKLICGYADFVIHEHDASCYDKDGNLVCTIPEHKLHQHTPECYQMQKQLVCSQEESVGHTHTPECYTKQQGALICGKEEHTHSEGCYDAEGNLICTLEEHTHSDECYEWTDVLTCTIPESAGHTHSETCYQDVQVLICEEPAELHTHTAECYKDGVLACGKLELKEHKHSDECFTEKQVLVETLICDRVEHVHTDECYKKSTEETATSEAVTTSQNEETSSEDENSETASIEEASSEETSTEEASSEADTDAEEPSTEASIEETSLEEASTEETSLEAVSEDESEAESETESAEEAESESEVESESESETEESSSIEAESEEESSEEVSTEEESSEEESFEETSTEETSEEELTSEEASTEEETSEAEDSEVYDEINADEIWNQIEDGAFFISYIKDGSTNLYSEQDQNMIMLCTMDDTVDDYVTLLSSEPQGTDFREYITSSKVEKQVVKGNTLEWETATEFDNNDLVRVTLEYTLPENIVTSKNKSIWYQLPKEVVPNKPESGIVYDKHNVKVGNYSIGMDGMIQITFDDEFATGNTISGDIYFSGKVQSENTKEDQKVEFGGKSTTIIIKQEKEEEVKTDIYIKKKGTLSEDRKKIHYSVEVGTTLGTGTNVDIDDYLTNGTYDNTSFKVKDSTGNVVDASKYTFEEVGGHFSIKGLPALNAGEKYTVEYDAIPGNPSSNGEIKVDNTVKTNKNQQAQETIIVKKSMISKDGQYDPNTETITWTITIVPDGDDLAGFVISDQLNGMDLTGCKAKLTYKSNGQDVTEDIELPYTFDKNKKYDSGTSYTITYKTKVSSSEMSGNEKNTATIKKDGKEYTASKDVGYQKQDWGLEKTSGASQKVDGKEEIIYNWKSRILLPTFKKIGQLEKFTYVDEIQSTPEKHLAVKEEIEQKINETIKLTYIDQNGTENTASGTEIKNYFDYTIKYTGNDNTVSGFEIEFTPKQGVDVKGKQIEFGYQTRADISKVAAGDSADFYNTAKVKDITKTVKVTYKKPVRFQKGSSVIGSLNPEEIGHYSNASKFLNFIQTSASVKLDENGYLYYRLALRPEKPTDTITITDTLPVGTSFVENSAYSAYAVFNDNGKITQVHYYDGNDHIVTNVAVKKETLGENESYEKLTFTLSGINTSKINDANGIAVYYAVKVDESILQGTGTVALKNTAEWNGEKSENTTNVKRTQKVIEKTGTQKIRQDENGEVKYVNAVQYKVVINPGADKLNPNGDTIKLVDKLSYTGLANVYLNLNTVKLYAYDATKEDLCSAEISSTRYQISYSDENKLTVVLPDELACVLVYEYSYDIGNAAAGVDGVLSGASISNKASLMGEISTAENKKLQISDSGATAKQPIKIYKVDANDYTKKLSGAEFKLEKYVNNNGWEWVLVNECLKSGEGGEMELQISGNSTIEKNYVYRMTETKAPEGYEKSSEPFYFIYTDYKKTDLKNNLDKINGWYNGLSTDLTTIDGIHLVSIHGGNLYIPNTANQINVKKIWLDSTGNPLENPNRSIEVQLYRTTGRIDGVTVTIQCRNDPDQQYFIERGSTVSFYFNNVTNCDYFINGKKGNLDGKKSLAVENIQTDTVIKFDNWAKPDVIDCTDASDVVFDENAVSVETTTLNAENNWSYAWKNLDLNDTNGNKYYYYVKEVGSHSDYKVSYMNNGGIQSGEIVITNRMEEKPIVLPETGGTGTYWYTMGGVLLIAGAAFLIYKKHMQKGGKRIW